MPLISIFDSPIADRERNFKKYSTNIIDSRNIDYDYNSIMHYSKYHFTKDGSSETVVPKENSAKIGQRVGLSELDVKQAKLLYNCGLNGIGQGQSTMMPDGDMDTDAER